MVYDEIDETQVAVGQHNAAINPNGNISASLEQNSSSGCPTDPDHYYLDVFPSSNSERPTIHGVTNAAGRSDGGPHYQPLRDNYYQRIVPKGGSLLPDIRVSDLKKYVTSLKDKGGRFEEEFEVRGFLIHTLGHQVYADGWITQI